jgi:hypothetical protein
VESGRRMKIKNNKNNKKIIKKEVNKNEKIK